MTDLLAGRVACLVTPDTWHLPSTLCAACKAVEAPRGERKVVEVTKPRAGERHESALYGALAVAGYWEFLPGCDIDKDPPSWLRQYPWGAFLSPPRRFSSDAGFPGARLLVEVEGQVHSIKGKRHGDVRRRQLAEAAGWRVLSLLPEQIATGEALQLVRAALEQP